MLEKKRGNVSRICHSLSLAGAAPCGCLDYLNYDNQNASLGDMCNLKTNK